MKLPEQNFPVIRAGAGRDYSKSVGINAASILRGLKNRELTGKLTREALRALRLAGCKAKCESLVKYARETCIRLCMKYHHF